jgi:hypothetical protein
MMFAVEVVLDDQLKGKAWLRVTHNNNSWSSLPLNSQEEVNSTIEALQAFIGFHPIEAAQHSVQSDGVCPRVDHHKAWRGSLAACPDCGETL